MTAQRARSRTAALRRTRQASAVAVTLGLAVVLAACGGADDSARSPAPAPPAEPEDAAPAPLSAPAQLLPGDPTVLEDIPALGPETLAAIGDDTEQVLVSASPESDSDNAATTYYERTDEGWVQRAHWRGHNGSGGWLEDRREGDRTSPVGVFELTDAGGYREDPGAKLPYTREGGYRESAMSVYGDDMAEVFNYVIAINYNRVPGTPPSDDERPEGWDKGGKIWLHVDHGKGTRGCVTIPEEGMEFLLTTLDPELNPVIVMGSHDDVSR